MTGLEEATFVVTKWMNKENLFFLALSDICVPYLLSCFVVQSSVSMDEFILNTKCS